MDFRPVKGLEVGACPRKRLAWRPGDNASEIGWGSGEATLP